MFRLAAIVAFVLAIIFYAWNINHDVWTYTLFTLVGLLCWCISDTTTWPWSKLYEYRPG
jgi:hypothetical protein